MTDMQTLSPEEQLDVKAEILRHLWYEGQATPEGLVDAFRYDRDVLQSCLEDLAHRGLIFEFLLSPRGPDHSVYCLTRRATRRIQGALRGYSRYKLKSFWEALKQEQRLLHSIMELD